jgi:hypothetical protein
LKCGGWGVFIAPTTSLTVGRIGSVGLMTLAEFDWV